MKKSDTAFNPNPAEDSPGTSRLKVPAQVKVRPFSPGDLDAVVEIQNTSRPIAAFQPRDYEQLALDPRGMILVAEAEGRTPPEIMGFSVFHRVHPDAELWYIAVAPLRRRQGVARALLREACRRLTIAGTQRLYLEVRRSNTPAIELYHSLGFTLLLSRKDYYQNPVEDALLLVCELLPPGA